MNPKETHLHVYIHEGEHDPRVGEILTIVRNLSTQGDHIMADLTRLTTEVTETRTVVDSAVVLLGQLSDLIRQNASDPAALNALADQLDSDQTELAAAVAANTPAADVPPS